MGALGFQNTICKRASNYYLPGFSMPEQGIAQTLSMGLLSFGELTFPNIVLIIVLINFNQLSPADASHLCLFQFI